MGAVSLYYINASDRKKSTPEKQATPAPVETTITMRDGVVFTPLERTVISSPYNKTSYPYEE